MELIVCAWVLNLIKLRLFMRDFSFTAKQGTDSKDYVFLLFDHLYAALRVRMRVHSDYSKLRTIKLKSLQLDTQAGEQKTTKKTTITIKLKANDGSGRNIIVKDKAEFDAAGLNMLFVQYNESKSKKGVLRGLHFQK